MLLVGIPVVLRDACDSVVVLAVLDIIPVVALAPVAFVVRDFPIKLNKALNPQPRCVRRSVVGMFPIHVGRILCSGAPSRSIPSVLEVLVVRNGMLKRIVVRNPMVSLRGIIGKRHIRLRVGFGR